MGAAAAPAVPQILSMLTWDDADLRETALETLQALGPVAKAAVPMLADMVDESGPRQARLAAAALEAVTGR